MSTAEPATEQQFYEENEEIDGIDEAGPLLRASHDDTQPVLGATVTQSKVTWEALLLRYILVLCFILILLLEIGIYLQFAPVNNLMEATICRDLFPDIVTSDDPRCKSTPVQSKLAKIQGWGATFDCIPGILTAIPYGVMSDKYGRKLVLLLSLCGGTMGVFWTTVVLTWPNVFPIWMVWFSAAFAFIGGGFTVVVSMFFTIIADVIPNDQRATTFFRLAAAIQVGEMIGNPLSAALMDQNTWLPIYTGLSVLLIAIALVIVFPETLGLRVTKLSTEDIPSHDDTTPTDGSSFEQDQNDASRSDSWKARLITHIRETLKTSLTVLQSDKYIIFLISTLLFSTLGRYVVMLLMQYAAKRYSLSWSRAAYIITLRSATSLVLLVIILPTCSALLLRRFSPNGKDIWLARVSGTLLTVGAFGIALATNPILMSIGLVIMSLGGGFSLLVRSLLTSLVEPHHVGTLYNAIAVVETMGLMAAGPMLSAAFSRGLEMGGMWVGLPFAVAGALFAVSTTIVFSLRLSTKSMV